MTLLDSEEINCVKCAHTFSFTMHKSINVSMAPRLKGEFLKGKINRAVCPNCNTAYNIGGAVLYHDMDNRIMIYVLLSEEYSNNKEQAVRDFAKIMRESVANLAGVMRQNFEKYNFDVVFNVDELKESLDSMKRDCNEKIRMVTKEVLALKPEYEEKSHTKKGTIKKWLDALFPLNQKGSRFGRNEELQEPEKYISIRGERIDLKYFPELKIFSEIDSKGLESAIRKIMDKNNLDAKNAMIILEKLTKRVTERVSEKSRE